MGKVRPREVRGLVRKGTQGTDFWPLNPIGPLGCTIPSLGVRVVLGVLRASRG